MKDGFSAPSEELEKLQKDHQISTSGCERKGGQGSVRRGELLRLLRQGGKRIPARGRRCANARQTNPKIFPTKSPRSVSEYGPDEETEEILKEENAEEKAEESLAGRELVTRYRRSFRSRLIQNENIQEFYSQLKNNILGYAGVKCRMSFHYESSCVGKSLIAKFNVSGKTLCLYLALAPSLYENGKYRFEDVSAEKDVRARADEVENYFRARHELRQRIDQTIGNQVRSGECRQHIHGVSLCLCLGRFSDRQRADQTVYGSPCGQSRKVTF